MREYEIGDSAYLKDPVKGYSYVEVIGHDGQQLVVETTSGMEIVVYEDELEDEHGRW